MIISSESEMLKFGEDYAKNLQTPAVIELVGDVGAGKTTFVRGLAKGLKISEPVTSPSFTISKSYAFKQNGVEKTLIHYDFYRLPDPGLMSEDLAESLADENAVIIVEWADSVGELLPEKRQKITIAYREDGSREVEIL